ncbi:DNA-binding protein [Microbacterium sulfonylureivorans]|uniref:DNA-binding protein n=1 Tax=Microbacterium sulfonylureivorans TaxID=2486854 RepID=UPI000FDA9995|nr:DNA-binding protein [Microbacterium sulfonylureivorans]
MFVVTADQRDSRINDDLVPAGLDAVSALAGSRLALAPERTAGDEIQVALPDAGATLEIVLHLTRLRTWSVGIGVGSVEEPLPANVRAARGAAFLHARDAVERAKRAPTRVAMAGGQEGSDAEALLRLLIELRDRRTPEGWEIHDLLAEGLSQRAAAARLGITEGAVSLRARNAGLRAEEAALPALERVLARADDVLSPPPRARG